jgi:hypothetical protein
MVPKGGGLCADGARRVAQAAQQLNLDKPLERRILADVIAIIHCLKHVVVALRARRYRGVSHAIAN